MPNLTITMDEPSLASAKRYAAERGTSVSALLRSCCDQMGRELRWGPRPPPLSLVIRTLRERRGDLARLGVKHAGVFGSVARGDADFGSDVDVAVELEPGRDVFDLAKLAGYLTDALGARVDVASLGPVERSKAGEDVVHAF